MVLGLSKREREQKNNNFMHLAVATHNATITNIQYSNKKIIKPLFWVGAVLPDFKISWGILCIYLIYTYPISLKIMVSNKISDIKTDLYLLLLRRRYI